MNNQSLVAWQSLDEDAQRVLKLAQDWQAGIRGGAGPIEECTRIADRMMGHLAKIKESRGGSAILLMQLGISLSPIWDAGNIMTAVIEEHHGPASFSQPDALAFGFALVSAGCRPALAALQDRDATFSGTPPNVVASLIQPIAFLVLLAGQLKRVPPAAWPRSLPRQVVFAEGIIDTLKDLLDIQRGIYSEQPQGQQLVLGSALASDGRKRMTLAGETLWCLVPGPLEAMCSDAGLTPRETRALFFKWAACYDAFYAVTIRKDAMVGQRLQKSIQMVAKLLTVSTESAADGDLFPAEKERALECIKNQILPIVYALYNISDSEGGMPQQQYMACVKGASSDASVKALLPAVAALRDLASKSDVSMEFALFPSRICLSSTLICAYCAYKAAGSAPAAQIAALCGSTYIACICMAISCWTDFLRVCCLPDFDVDFDDNAQVILELIGSAVKPTWLMQAAAAEMGDYIDKYPTGRARAGPLAAVVLAVPATPLLDLSRSLADFTASIPAVIDLVKARPVLARAASPMLEAARVMSIKLSASAIVYSQAAVFSSRYVDTIPAPYSDKEFISVAQTAHASIKTAMVLAKKRQWPQEAALGVTEIRKPQKTVVELTNNGIDVCEAFQMRDFGGEAPVLVALHALAVLAALSEDLVAIAASNAPYISTLFAMPSMRDDLARVLLPGDALGIQRVLQYGKVTPDYVPVLEDLIEAAKSTEGLEQRERERLEMLGRLPAGVCANFLCSEPLPPAVRLKVCSGCGIARFCGPKCFKYAWKHGGHKAPCQAVQREREG